MSAIEERIKRLESQVAVMQVELNAYRGSTIPVERQRRQTPIDPKIKASMDELVLTSAELKRIIVEWMPQTNANKTFAVTGSELHNDFTAEASLSDGLYITNPDDVVSGIPETLLLVISVHDIRIAVVGAKPIILINLMNGHGWFPFTFELISNAVVLNTRDVTDELQKYIIDTPVV